MSDEKARPREGDDIQGELEGLVGGDAAPGAPPPETAREDRAVESRPGIEAARTGGEEDSASEEEPADRATPADRETPLDEAVPPDEAGPPDDEAPPGEPPEEDPERLTRSLEMLEERVTLLLERHAELLGSHREAVEELDRKSARLERLRSSGEDPERLLERIRSLEAENDRLSEHAAFLEGRIESLLNRVRYVVES